MDKQQIKRIYGLGAALGIVGKDRDDELHTLVAGVCGKESVSSLTDEEFSEVERELLSRLRLGHAKHPPLKRLEPESKASKHSPLKRPEPESKAPGMITEQQMSLAWRYIYRLRELDVPGSAEVGDRMIGAIAKVLGITASKSDPFIWVTQEDASKLIEQLKRYVASAERKARRAALKKE